ncbi:MAG: ABC transporter ATP-binding protein [Clostridia bacterium]|nr:ABC transporter ATP-binding protein [Clostridia bacterium]MBR0227255.1 ABC transporter ATP-binding protein [Clostridia bacterium]
MEQTVLEVKNLTVSFHTEKGVITPVNGVWLRVPAGKIVGVVGESGCGKSMTARAIMGLIKFPGKVTGGEILLDGRNIAVLPEKQRRALRGAEISMIFQEPMTSLNPVVKVGRQVDEAVRLHTHCTRAEAKRKTLEMFREVEIPEPETRYNCYPHQLSGGLRQRVMIAMAMICRPRLLIADEPTTALDVTVEAQILKLLEKLRDGGTSVLLISHNLGVIARTCDEVSVMYAGRIVEHGETAALFEKPLHPYTRGLLRSVASLRAGGETLQTIPGVVPNLLHLSKGCAFSLRCGQCGADCEQNAPEFREIAPGHFARCFRTEKEGEE